MPYHFPFTYDWLPRMVAASKSTFLLVSLQRQRWGTIFIARRVRIIQGLSERSPWLYLFILLGHRETQSLIPDPEAVPLRGMCMSSFIMLLFALFAVLIVLLRFARPDILKRLINKLHEAGAHMERMDPTIIRVIPHNTPMTCGWPRRRPKSRPTQHPLPALQRQRRTDSIVGDYQFSLCAECNE